MANLDKVNDVVYQLNEKSPGDSSIVIRIDPVPDC